MLDRVPLIAPAVRRSTELLYRHGTRAVFTARLMPLARTFVSLPAGARRVPLTQFVAFTTIGSALWAIAFVLAGLIAGTAWRAVSSIVGPALLAAGLLTITATLIRQQRRG